VSSPEGNSMGRKRGKWLRFRATKGPPALRLPALHKRGILTDQALGRL
jgi:hypothetical protein